MCEQEKVGDLSGDGVGHSSGGLVMPPSYPSLSLFFFAFTGEVELVVESRGTHTDNHIHKQGAAG